MFDVEAKLLVWVEFIMNDALKSALKAVGFFMDDPSKFRTDALGNVSFRNVHGYWLHVGTWDGTKLKKGFFNVKQPRFTWW